MMLKLCLIAFILNCVVLASCEETQEILAQLETNAESIIESKTEENVDLSAIDNLEITVPLNESLENNESTPINSSTVSDKSTSNDTENNTGEMEDMTVATTEVDNNDSESSTHNETETITKESNKEVTQEPTDTEVSTVNVTEDFTVNTNEVTENIRDQPSVNVTDATTTTVVAQEPTIVESTEDVTEEPTIVESTEDVTQEPSIQESTEDVTEEPSISESTETVIELTTTTTTELPTTTTTTELPTTPIDILCPQVPESEIDPKYRNETFFSYLDEFMSKNPSAKIFQSPGFPGPYAANLNCTLSETLTNCTGVDVVVHYLDLNPFLADSLNIRGGEESASNEKGKKLTGHQLGIRFKIIHSTSLFIWFNSGAYTEDYRGFLLTYSPYGNDTVPPTTTEAPVTIPPSEVQVYELQLVVPEKSKTNSTWQKFKEVLAGSASKYVTDQNLNYDLAHPDNVTIDIFNCPNNWPNYKNCVRLQFSISLWSTDHKPEDEFDTGTFDYELSTNSLSIMWDLFGRDDFLEILGIEEYSIPDGTYVLLLWTGVSLTIVAIFIVVLYSIWRIDIFREYRRMNNKTDDLQDIHKTKSELDISMYPIPHQPYPTLFETNEVNTGGYYDSYENSAFQGHTFRPEKPPGNFRHATDHFSPNIIDFNDSQLFPDDEEDFGRGQSLSPRSKHKLLVIGAKRDESNS